MRNAEKSGTRVLVLRLRLVSAVCAKGAMCTSSIGSREEMLLTTGRLSAVRCALDPRPVPAARQRVPDAPLAVRFEFKFKLPSRSDPADRLHPSCVLAHG